MNKQHTILNSFFIIFFVVLIGLGIANDGLFRTIRGFLNLQIKHARLISDFIAMEGLGPAFLNAVVVAGIGILCMLFAGITFSGVTFAAIFTLLGFGLFGKTPLNILPIIFGVFMASKIAGKSFKEYIIIALFGTALGPLVSFTAFEIGIHLAVALPLSIGLGIIIGFFLPSIAMSMLHLHQGYNLYNIGLTCGFLGLFGASVFKISKIPFEKLNFWYSQNNPILLFLVPGLSLLFILLALILSHKQAWKGIKAIFKVAGRLPSDFFQIGTLEGGLLNAGIIGIFGSLLVLATGSSFNGPVIGGLFTIIGFAAFGTHLRNSWPVILGVIVSALIFSLPLNSSGVILAIIFCTTLGPLAGEFGIIIGIIAGFIHMVMVSQTGSWHGAMNLYNNGFAGGLTASLLVAIIQWFKNNVSINKKNNT